MSTSENTIPNDTEEIKCAICGRIDPRAHEFEFHYGKKRTTEKASKVDPKAYDVKGEFTGYVCHNCFFNSHLLVIFIGMFLAVGIFFGSIYVQFAIQQAEFPIMIWLIAIAIGYGTYQVYNIVKKYYRGNIDKFVTEDASKLLIKKRSKELVNKGFDTFWTTDEYNQMMDKLKPKPAPKPEQEAVPELEQEIKPKDNPKT